MNSNTESQIDRAGKKCLQWCMDEHTRLQADADRLWAALDPVQPQEQFYALLVSYHATCDQMDAIESFPECTFARHEIEFVIKNGARFPRCLTCDTKRVEALLRP